MRCVVGRANHCFKRLCEQRRHLLERLPRREQGVQVFPHGQARQYRSCSGTRLEECTPVVRTGCKDCQLQKAGKAHPRVLRYNRLKQNRVNSVVRICIHVSRSELLRRFLRNPSCCSNPSAGFEDGLDKFLPIRFERTRNLCGLKISQGRLCVVPQGVACACLPRVDFRPRTVATNGAVRILQSIVELFRVKVSGRSVREQFASLQTIHLLYLEGLRVELNSLRDVTLLECLVGPRPERHAGRRNDRIEI
mmetsp:Transcript_1752/g.3929  ORF Transcript_1752/g.3929 Transcript_1752/m.3929 type:complete len:250 (-) Transcript_1752:35-784(-)